MRVLSRINGNIFAASLVSFIITICFSGNWVYEEQACSYSNEAGSCSSLLPNGGIAEKMFEKSDGKYTPKLKSDVLLDTSSSSSSSSSSSLNAALASMLSSSSSSSGSGLNALTPPSGADPVKFRNAVKEFLPEEAATYQKCATSGRGMTALTHWGAPVTNAYCIALGCGNKQCVKFTQKCNKDEGTCEMSDGKCKEPTMECTALPALNSEMSPIRFTCFFFGLIASGLGCMCSCIIPSRSPDLVKPE